MKPLVLITKRIYPEAVELLSGHCEVDYEATDMGLTTDQLVERARGKRAIVSQLTDRLSADVIKRLSGVKLIANVAVGYDNIDIEAATRAGMLVTNTPGVLTDTTADLAFALLMATARRLVEAHQFIHDGKWERWTIDLMVGRDIHHATLGIVGLGRIGQAVARRAKGFDMRVLYTGRNQASAEVESETGAEYVALESLLTESDFVSLHVPLSDATRHLIGETELRKMKPTAVLINTARGLVVDEEALAKALADGTIAGAGLDVFEREPKVHAGLLHQPRAVLTPHIGSASVATRLRMSMIAAENVVALVSGNRPPNLLNPAALG